LREGVRGYVAILADDARFAIDAPPAELVWVEDDLHLARARGGDEVEKQTTIIGVERATDFWL